MVKKLEQRLFFVVNDLGYFISHRLQLALAAKRDGYDVSILYGEIGLGELGALQKNKISCIKIPIKRGKLNPFQDIFCAVYLWFLFKLYKPTIVHLITIKPYLYGGIAARLANVPSVVTAIAGMGSVFINTEFLSGILRVVLKPFLKLALTHKRQIIITQNQEDRAYLENWLGLSADKFRLIPGSGVDLKMFSMTPLPKGAPVVTFVSRLLKDKGVYEIVAAARVLLSRNVKVRFWIVGKCDKGNPTSITEKEINKWVEEGVVEALGYRKNINKVLEKTNIVCLPSYREGFPKSLMEAAAAGRPIVTTDVPGCRDTIIPNVSGLLVPPKNINKLVEVLEALISSPSQQQKMGAAGRKLAEERFSVEYAVRQHMAIYRELRI